MKKVLLILLGIIVTVGVLAGAGFAGYRIGYQQGALANTDGINVPLMHGFRLNPQDMPMHNFGRDLDRGYNQGFGPNGYMMQGRGMGFFSPLMSLGHIIFWGLVIWFVYWLFTRSGWKLSLTRRPVEVAKAETPEAEKKAE
jgi:hypothetical protein